MSLPSFSKQWHYQLLCILLYPSSKEAGLLQYFLGLAHESQFFDQKELNENLISIQFWLPVFVAKFLGPMGSLGTAAKCPKRNICSVLSYFLSNLCRSILHEIEFAVRRNKTYRSFGFKFRQSNTLMESTVINRDGSLFVRSCCRILLKNWNNI